jgi:oxygen-independent coproporphyrinogen-3 oxidase
MTTQNALPIALYIHMPWCVRKCPYCDFNSHELKKDLPENEYIDALLDDLSQDLPLVEGRLLTSIFIGGGTPSLFSPQAIERLLKGVKNQIPFEPNIEITLEANPGTVEQERFRGFLQAGVNRLSIGVQSFDEAHLKRLGRIHDGDAFPLEKVEELLNDGAISLVSFGTGFEFLSLQPRTKKITYG